MPTSRQFVHLSADEVTAKKVSARHGDPVVLHIAAESMHANGIKFYLSDNCVWLTLHVAPQYLADL